MASKTYTAKEMREAAIDLDWKSPSPFRKLKEHRMYVNMLRQAAEMRERIDDLLLTFHSCPDERDMLNYILRGDAGKEER